MSLDFPLLVRSRKFCCVFAPFPEKVILDFIAHRPIIQVFTVSLNAVEA